VQVERERLGHAVFAMVRREVIVPLPLFTGERLFGVDLDLLDGEIRVADELHGRFDEAGISHQVGEQIVTKVQPHRSPNDAARSLTEVLLAALTEQAGEPLVDRCDVVGREQLGDHDEPVPLEVRHVLFRQPLRHILSHRRSRDEG